MVNCRLNDSPLYNFIDLTLAQEMKKMVDHMENAKNGLISNISFPSYRLFRQVFFSFSLSLCSVVF